MLRKVQRESLTERAAQNLMAFISEQNLRPGDVLPAEARLSSELGVSRPVVREALRTLEGRGVIVVVNGKGAVVRPISSGTLSVFFQHAIQVNSETLLEMNELRRGIEVEAAMLAARRRTPAQLAKMQELAATMRAHLHDLDSFVELDVQLHLTIAQATHNSIMYHLIESLRDASKDIIRESQLRRQTADQFEQTQSLHEAIVASIAAADVEGARQAMIEHFDYTASTLSGATDRAARPAGQ
jgi:GntR family transcriptional repressor for pyruvate dehydrogenase complex